MRRDISLSALLFRVVCIVFSAVLLVMALFAQIRTVRTETRIGELERALADAENEKVLLEIKTDSALSPEERDRRAVTELGMRRPEPGQRRVSGYLGERVGPPNKLD